MVQHGPTITFAYLLIFDDIRIPEDVLVAGQFLQWEVWGSVAVTKGGIRKFPEGRYAEIELTTDDRYTAGSLQIAVTSTTPPALEGRKIKSIFMTPNARIIDVYGQIWATGEPEAMFGYPICNLEGNLTCEGWDTFAALDHHCRFFFPKVAQYPPKS